MMSRRVPSCRLLYVAAAGTALCVGAAVVRTQAGPAKKGPEAALVARGQYLVDRVAMCVDCHTPRSPMGTADMSRYLQGAEVSVKPLRPAKKWATRAPGITAGSIAKYGPGQLSKKLRGKLGTGGQSARMFKAPMPAYRLDAEDAQAVVAYLRTVKP